MNLKEVAKSKGTNIKQLAEKCGVPASTLYSISRGDTNLDNVGVDLFLKIAQELDIDAEDLYAMCKKNVIYTVVKIEDGGSDNEQELIGIYRSLPDDGKNQLIVFARGCAASYIKEER